MWLLSMSMISSFIILTRDPVIHIPGPTRGLGNHFVTPEMRTRIIALGINRKN
jgi:hypothetical protein